MLGASASHAWRMSRLACALALMASLGACMPDESQPSFPIVPGTSPPVLGSIVPADAGLVADAGPNVPDSGVDLVDGGIVSGADAGDFPQDAGTFLDAFDLPADAPEPSNPGGDQIP